MNKLLVYLILKSDLGQSILVSLTAETTMPQITASEINNIEIPTVSTKQREQTLTNFKQEMKLHTQINEIKKQLQTLHSKFLGHTMNYSSHSKLINFIYSAADDCLRDIYVHRKYRDVILPMVVLRRLDALLESTKNEHHRRH